MLLESAAHGTNQQVFASIVLLFVVVFCQLSLIVFYVRVREICRHLAVSVARVLLQTATDRFCLARCSLPSGFHL